MRAWTSVACGVAALAAWNVAGAEAPRQRPPLTDAVAIIPPQRFVDLTPSFAPGIPLW